MDLVLIKIVLMARKSQSIKTFESIHTYKRSFSVHVLGNIQQVKPVNDLSSSNRENSNERKLISARFERSQCVLKWLKIKRSDGWGNGTKVYYRVEFALSA